MKDNVPHILREMIRTNEACLVIGAGVSISASSNHQASSWKGLLQNGINHCTIYGNPPLEDNTAEKLVDILDSNDTDNWLAVATIIERKLNYPNSPEWNSWLYDSIGSIQLKNKNIIESILDLKLPILTTNYDGLFSDRSLSYPRRSVTWRDNSSVVHFMQNPLEYIFHLHGSYIQTESIVLGVSSYEHLLNTEFIQYIQRVLSLSYGLIFIGYGNGFEDQNFSALLKFINNHGTISPKQRHFILVKEGDQHWYNNIPNIYPVVYGDKYEDLPIFIRSLPFSIERYVYRSKRKHAELISSRKTFRDMAYCPEMVFIDKGKISLKLKGDIEIRKPFAIGKFPITVGDWDIFIEENGFHYRKFIINDSDKRLPITGITYFDVVDYCNWLSEVTGYTYRLPSENEWEYSALSGAKTDYWWGSKENTNNANFRNSKLGHLTPVSTYPENNFNLNDFFGNSWEWTLDNYCENRVNTTKDETPFYTSHITDTEKKSEHILKGGCFYYQSDFMKASSRIHLEKNSVFNSVGFRVVREIDVLLENGGKYFIVSIASPFALDVSQNNSNKACLSNFDMSVSQEWEIKFNSDQTFQIINYKNKKILSYNKTHKDYSNLKLVEPSNSITELTKFKIEKGLGGYMLVTKNSNKAIDLEGSRRESTPELILFESHGNFNQTWQLIPAF